MSLILACPASHRDVPCELLVRLMFGGTDHHESTVIRLANEMALHSVQVMRQRGVDSEEDEEEEEEGPAATTTSNNMSRIRLSPVLSNLSTKHDKLVHVMMRNVTEIIDVESAMARPNLSVCAVVFVMDLDRIMNGDMDELDAIEKYMEETLSKMPQNTNAYVFAATSARNTIDTDDGRTLQDTVAETLRLPASRVFVTNVFDLTSYAMAWSTVINHTVPKRIGLHRMLHALKLASNASCVALIDIPTRLVFGSCVTAHDNGNNNERICNTMDMTMMSLCMQAIDMFCELEQLGGGEKNGMANLQLCLANGIRSIAHRIEPRLVVICTATAKMDNNHCPLVWSSIKVRQQLRQVLEELYCV